MPGNLGDVTYGETGRVAYTPGAGQVYEPAADDVIWSTTDAALAWGVSPETVVKYCLAGRCKHLLLNVRTIVVLQRDKPPPVEPGGLTPEQREAMGKGVARKPLIPRRGRLIGR